jgi:carboxyl-terminal processing protease
LLPQLLVLFFFVGASTHAGEQPKHDLSAMRTFTKVLISLKEQYAEPQRIKPKEMMVAALEHMEKTVPDVIVNGNPGTGQLTVTAGDKTRDFDISMVENLWKLAFRLKDVFQFIHENMSPIKDTREVEYAAIDGMLSTLDRNSVLLRPERVLAMKKARQDVKDAPANLGIVVGFKEDHLTVERVLPQGPAAQTGLQRGDQLTKIGGEPTEGMSLMEALSRLRGPEGSTVTLTVKGVSSARPRELTLTRALPTYYSGVQHKLLASGVGYLRLEDFPAGADEEVQTALEKLGEEAGPGGLKGLVLDLRGNAGGLLNQAVAISDLFLSQGNIVTVTGMGKGQLEVKTAQAQGGDFTSPLVVLVDTRSASAAEITAGALQQLDRAVVIGQRTFGKSSVQALYDHLGDVSLKLTVAHYQTPDGTTFEGTGILPDIELEPSPVTRDRVNLYSPREAKGLAARGKPAERLQYLKRPDTEQVELHGLDRLEEDFEVLFARDFVLKAPSPRRGEMLWLGKDYVEQKRREEEARLHEAIAALGVDWSPGPTPKAPQLALSLKPGADQTLRAGGTFELEVTVENQGQEPVRRLRAWTDSSDNAVLARHEFLFGAVNPGQKRSWKVPVWLPLNLSSRRDAVTVRLQDDSGMLSPSVTAELNLVESPRPTFALRWQVEDRCTACNGDGRVHPGETVNLRVDLTNTGAGKAVGMHARLKTPLENDPVEAVLLDDDDSRPGTLAPGETKAARFQVTVPGGYTQNTFALKLAISALPLEEKEERTESLVIPVHPQAAPVESLDAVVRLGTKTELLSAPEADARPLGRLLKNVVVRQVAQVDGFAKVMLDESRFAFVKASSAKPGPKLKPAPVTEKELALAAPIPESKRISVSLDGVNPALGGLVTTEDPFTLSGTVAFPRAGPGDLVVMVNGQKVFFQTRPYAEAYAEGPSAPLKFTTTFALKEGLNQVRVVAIESPESTTSQTLVIRRRPADTATR